MGVEEEIAEAMHEVQMALPVRQRRGAFLGRREQLPLSGDVLLQRGEASQDVLVAAEIGGEHPDAEELPPRGRPFDPEQFAVTAAGYGIELLGPSRRAPGALVAHE